MKPFITLLFLSALIGFSFNDVKAQNVALHFDGSDDFVQTTYPGISGQNSRTVEAMIRTTANCDPNNSGKQKVIVDWGTTSTGGRFTLNILWGNALRLEVSGSGLNGQTVINDGKWHHVAATYTQVGKQNEIKLYVDGVLDTSGSIPTSVNTGSSVNMRIGQRVDGVNNFEGDIDEVRIFSHVRSQSDIKADINKEYCNYPKGLVAYYKLNEGNAGSSNSSNKTAKDYSGSKNGTLTNFALTGTSSNWITGDTLTGGDSKSTIDAFGCYTYTSSDGTVYSSPGKYTTTMTNAAGCDSIITLNVTLGRVYHFTRHTACDSFITPLGNVHYQTGFYRDTLVGVTPKGCDSVLIMEVKINHKLETQEDLVVCDSTSVDGKWYFSDVKLTQEGSAVTGCDSVHTIDITVNESSTNTIFETHCDRYKSSLGNTYTKTGIYKEKLSKANKYKCDSVITIDLTIHNSSDLYFPVRGCDSFTSPSGKVYAVTGVYTEKFTTQFGCDSTVVYDLVLYETKQVEDKVEACDSIRINDVWRTVSGIIEFTETTAAGCDSFVTVDLQVTNVNNNVVKSGHTLTANQTADSYQWWDCKTERPIKGASSMLFTAPYSGTFAVDVTLNNCTKRSDCYDVIGLGVSNDANSGLLVLLSPNPNEGTFTLTSNDGQIISSFQVTDISGRLIQSQTNLFTSTYDVSCDLVPGIYIVNIEINNQIMSKKFVVQ